jgi:hypothetical protein
MPGTWRGRLLVSVAAFSMAIADSALTSAQQQPWAGVVNGVLEALGVPVESQLLVFSKTGVQRPYTSTRKPRAIFFDESGVVAYVPGAPAIKLAAHDSRKGVVFYTLDQAAVAPVLIRGTSSLACHVSASTLDVPGMIVRSNTLDDSGNVMPAARQLP